MCVLYVQRRNIPWRFVGFYDDANMRPIVDFRLALNPVWIDNANEIEMPAEQRISWLNGIKQGIGLNEHHKQNFKCTV